MDALIQRITALERQCAAAEQANRHWHTVALVVLSAGVAAAACGSQTGGPSTAKAFECGRIRIVEGGKVLAEIGKRDGGVELLCSTPPAMRGYQSV